MPVYGPNVVPTMTGYTTPSGEASADSEQGQAAWKAFDGNDATFWYANTIGDIGWLQYRGSARKRIQKIVLLGLGGADVGYYPKTWTFRGSNDGITETVLYTAADTSAHDDGARHGYEFANPDSFLYHRIDITATAQVGPLRAPAIAALEMYEVVGEEAPPAPSALITSGLGLTGLGLGL